jgi:hypothetical protein
MPRRLIVAHHHNQSRTLNAGSVADESLAAVGESRRAGCIKRVW